MSLLLGSSFPNPDVETTHGRFKLHDYQGDSWLIFFTHPADYTPVCTTELGRAVNLFDEFTKRNVKMIALSCDSVEDHKGWSGDVMAFCNKAGEPLPYPIIADPQRDLAVRFGMLDPVAKDASGMPLTCRAVFVVDPNHTMRLSILYPASTGRNFDEILRVIDSLQLNSKIRVVTPVDWKQGDKVIVPPGADAKDYPNAVETVQLPSGKGYLRYTNV